jgi:DNA-binding response OmpR family regulator
MEASRPRVLVVDDIDSRRIFRDALRPAGFDVDTAATASTALDRLATRHYAVIVADCTLPGLAPLDWLAVLRGAALSTPLILCSETIGDELRRQAAVFGAAAVLEKPFSVWQLLAAVRAALQSGLTDSPTGPLHSERMPRLFRLIVVRRDRQQMLHHILSASGRWPPRTAVMLDRRVGERRTRLKRLILERRRGTGRGEPDVMWHTGGFIVVETHRIPRQAVLL